MYSIVKGSKRHRYIGFIIEPYKNDISRSELIKTLRIQCNTIFNKECKDMGIYLIQFNGRAGIIKCNHIEKESSIHLLKSIKKIALKKREVTPIATSGTIYSLRTKHMQRYL